MESTGERIHGVPYRAPSRRSPRAAPLSDGLQHAILPTQDGVWHPPQSPNHARGLWQKASNGVVEGLYSEFNKYRTRSVDVAEQFHSLRRQCVGARSHGKPNHSLHRQRLVVKPPELSGRSPVCICIRLEIGNIPHVGILSAKTSCQPQVAPLPLCPEAIGRSEGTVVAVDASAGTDCAASRLGQPKPAFTEIFCTFTPGNTRAIYSE